MNSSGKKKWVLLIVALILILVGGYLAYCIQTDGGKIKIKDVRFVGDDGGINAALLYIPPGVSDKTPAPGIVATHGYINSRETQDGFAIEFARRGYVVLAPDQRGHGFSDPPAFARGFGGMDTIKYIRSLAFVDKDNVGLEGHSMGGWASLKAAEAVPDGYRSMILEGSSPGTYGTKDGTPTFPRNTMLVYSIYDEFSMLMWKTLIPRDVVKGDKMKAMFGTTETIQPGKLYGSIADGTARILYQPPIIHPRDHISREAIGYAISWFQQTLKGGKPIPVSDQVWYWKEIGTLIALIGMILLLFPLGSLLMRTSFFSELNEATPEKKTVTGIGWWIGAILTVLIPLPLYIWAIGYSAPGKLKPSACWAQNVTTVIAYWALAVAVISLVLFLLWHFLLNRKKGATFASYGVTWKDKGLAWMKIWKSALLSILVVGVAYLTLIFSECIFLSDYRFWVFAIHPMTALQFRIFLSYLVWFLIYFLVISMILHGELRIGREGEPKLWKEMLVNIFLMITGYIIFEAWAYIPLFSGGSTPIPMAGLWYIVMFQFFPIFAIAACLMTYYFRKTGHIYAGAFICALLVTWIVVAGQATHFAF
jgi:pimeloyl-ACP methyl ester carboxylesterase